MSLIEPGTSSLPWKRFFEDSPHARISVLFLSLRVASAVSGFQAACTLSNKLPGLGY